MRFQDEEILVHSNPAILAKWILSVQFSEDYVEQEQAESTEDKDHRDIGDRVDQPGVCTDISH